MRLKLRSAAAVALIITFGIFLPSILFFENADWFMRGIGSGTEAEAEYTDGMEKNLLKESYLCQESPKEAFSTQKPEQRRSIYRLSIALFVFLLFSLGEYLKRVYLSYIQFYHFLFVRFLHEYYILLKKDGKKRSLAF